MIIGKTITENKEEMNWEEIISEKKTVSEISKETGYSESYIYFIARKLGLSFKTFRGKNRKSNKYYYKGHCLDDLKVELQLYCVEAVADKYNFELKNFKRFLSVHKISFFYEKKNVMKDTVAMIKFLSTNFSQAAIARVFGYSRERIRQILEEN